MYRSTWNTFSSGRNTCGGGDWQYRYALYTEWCASIGVHAAAIETWLYINNNIREW